jgi:hypothetical protein
MIRGTPGKAADALIADREAIDCVHELEVTQAVLAGAWPDACDATLVEHVERCAMCRDVAEVASMLGQPRGTLRGQVSVPAAGQVWWRAAVRARLEATERAARPMAWLHRAVAAIVGVAAVIIAGKFGDRAASMLGDTVTWIAARGVSVLPSPDEAGQLTDWAFQHGTVLVAALALCLLAAPVALYFALHDE